MRASQINEVWAELIIEELARNGVRHICISPGSRSTPLVLAAAHNGRISTTVHFDERGLAFYTLGLAKATGKSAAMICTSGTAVANAFPAIIEASLSFTPMIILSADRPVELRDSGAAQTVDQVKMFGNYLRWSFDLPSPDDAINPSFILTTIDQACYRATRSPAGPVQLNCMFREPLAPTGDDKDWSGYLHSVGRWLNTEEPYTRYSISSHVGNEEQIQRIAHKLQTARRGIIVAGVLPTSADKAPVMELANRLNWPLLADISSGIRSCGIASKQAVCHYDLYLRFDEFRRKYLPDLILHFGGLPISKHLLRYLSESSAEYVVVNDHPFRHDPEHQVSERIECDPAPFAGELVKSVVGTQSELSDVLGTAETISANVVRDYLISCGDTVTEFGIAMDLFSQIGEPRGIFLATSMPIREADSFVETTDIPLHVSANRGANGIDGTIATAVGFASGLELPATVSIGDLAFLHDLNSLALVKQAVQPIIIVVINNNGGGIFSFLPVAEIEDYFERYFGAPHGLSFENLAEQFGLEFHKIDKRSDFVAAYQRSLKSTESAIIEVTSERRQNVSHHRQIWQRVRDEIESALIGRQP